MDALVDMLSPRDRVLLLKEHAHTHLAEAVVANFPAYAGLVPTPLLAPVTTMLADDLPPSTSATNGSAAGKPPLWRSPLGRVLHPATAAPFGIHPLLEASRGVAQPPPSVDALCNQVSTTTLTSQPHTVSFSLPSWFADRTW